MAQPTSYTPGADFSADEAANTGGRSTVLTADLDAEFAAVETTLDGVLVNLALNQRDDGEIRDARVKLHTLNTDVLALFSATAGTPRGAWVTATAYALRDVVTQSTNTYICCTAHTSGVFATDLAAVKWLLVTLGSSPSAAGIAFTPAGAIAAANVQAAIQESDTENRALSAAYDAAVRADLADVAATTKGSGMVGFAYALAYGAGTLGKWLQDLATSVGSSFIGFLQSGTGAVATTAQAKMRERLSVFDFLTTAQIADVQARTLTLDLTTAIQAAITAAGATGGALHFPAGSYRVTSALTLSVAGVTLTGDGYGTVLSTSSATANIFTVSAQNVWIRSMRFTSSVVRSAGWFIDIAAGGSLCRVSDFRMDSWIGGIRTLGAASVTIERGVMHNGVAATGVGVRIDAGFDVTVRDVVSDQAAQIFASIYVTNAGDVTIEDCNLIHGGNALYVSPGAGQTVTSLWVNNTFFDTGTRGTYLLAAGGSIARCMFEQCWFSSNTSQGALLATSGGGTIDGVHFTDCQFFLNASDGLAVADTGVINCHVRGGSAAQNISSGYSFAANTTRFSVIGARSGAGDGLLANGYGIFVAAGTSANYTLANNTLRSNTTAPLVDGGTGTGKAIHTNPDYDTGSAVYDPPNLADGAGVTTTVSVFGAVLGDYADAAFSLDLQGITLTSWVSAAGTVSVRFQNETGGALDLASGTLRARVARYT